MTKESELDTKISSLFLPFEAEEICRIPLSRRISGDVLYWPWEKNYNFSVKYAYHLVQKKKKDSLAGPSCVSQSWNWI